MYKVKSTNFSRYPWVVLHLVNVVTGEEGSWITTSVYEEDLCNEYHVKDLTGSIIDILSVKGEWIKTKKKTELV